VSIAESAGSALGRKVGPLPLGGWAAIGIGTIVVVKLLRGGGKSSSDVVTVPDAFAGYADGGGGAGTSGGGSGTTIPATSPAAGSPNPAVTGVHYRLSLTGRTQFYSTLGKALNMFGNSGTWDTFVVTVAGKKFYKIKRLGISLLIPVNATTIKVVPR